MKFVFVTLTAALAGTTAFAGGYTPPVQDPQPVVAPIVAPVETGSDWTGAYVGLQYGQGDLDIDYPETTDPDGTVEPAGSESVDLDGYGVHGGYLHDFGKYVLGGELDYNNIEVDDNNSNADLWRLRGRAGYDAGRFLPYATLGVARLSGDDESETGISYGLGVDFKVTEKFTVGAEYSRQSFDDALGIDGVDLDLDLIQVRGSYHF